MAAAVVARSLSTGGKGVSVEGVMVVVGVIVVVGATVGGRVPAPPPAPKRGEVGWKVLVGIDETDEDSDGAKLDVGTWETEGLVERKGLCDTEGISVVGALEKGELVREKFNKGLELGSSVGLTGAKVGNSVG